MRLLSVLLILTFILGLAACTPGEFRESKTFAGGIVATAQQLNTGKMVYMENCYACHGADGGGAGPAAKGLVPPPRNFKQGLFKFGNVVAGGLPTDEDLYRIIRWGLHGSAMLPWDLEKPAVMAAIQYIKTFAPEQWEGKGKELGDVMKLTKDPYGLAHRDSAIQRGMEVYHIEANCQSCHRAYVTKKQYMAMAKKINNENLTMDDIEENFYELKLQDSEYVYDGTEQTVKYLPPDYTWHPMRSINNVDDIFLRLKSGVGGTSMPSWHEVLTDEDIWAVSHYVDYLSEMRKDPAKRKAFMNKLANQ